MMARGRDAIVQAQEGPPYGGRPGQTRLENVHLAGPGGSVRTVEVYRVVNVGADPQLRERALSGDLHRLEDGVELALPFVFHDPVERKFALVVPSMLAHHELREWSALMGEIAAETDHPVPRYVREAMTVVGLRGLSTFVEAPAELDDSELTEASNPAFVASAAHGAGLAEVSDRERVVLEREREVADQERGLVRTAEGMTAREGELLRREEQLQTALADLEIREQELAAQRARVIAASEPSPASEGGWQEVGADETSPSAEGRSQHARTTSPPPLHDARVELGGDVGDLSNTEATVVVDSAVLAREAAASTGVGAATGTGPPALRTRVRQHPPPLHEASHEEPTAAGGRPPPLPGMAVEDAELVEVPPGAIAAREVHRSDAHPEVDPPTGVVGGPVGEMAHRLHADELWLYVNWPESGLEALRASPDLMLQCIEIDESPVLVLALFAHAAGETGGVARLVLAALEEPGGQLLENLERSFRARIAVYIDGQYRETLTVALLREGVARVAREFVESWAADRARRGGEWDDAAVVAKVVAEPPGLDSHDLPFGPARRQMSGIAAVRAAAEQLESWMSPERVREATLRYGIPQHVIDASARRVLRAALVHGVFVSEALAAEAVRYGVASNERELVAEQLRAYKHRIAQGDNDLDEQGTRRNWELLFEAAERLGVEVAQELREFAESLGLGSVVVDVGRPSPVADSSQLCRQLGDAEHRVGAFQELCRRLDREAVPHLMEHLEDFLPAELAACAPHLARFGEHIADELGNTLASQSMHVRHVGALLLGRLQQRRTLSPLLRALQEEPTAVWSEMARAVGEFGSAALLSLARAIPKSKDPDRLMVALAHAANHGGAKDVEKMENSESVPLALAARRAMARRSRLEWEDLAIREQRTLTDNSPTARFSQSFFATVARLEP